MLFETCILLICITLLFGIIWVCAEKEVLPGFFILLFCAFCGLCIYAGLKEKERQAIVAGVAHYKTVIDKGGNVSNEFVWGPKKDEKALDK